MVVIFLFAADNNDLWACSVLLVGVTYAGYTLCHLAFEAGRKQAANTVPAAQMDADDGWQLCFRQSFPWRSRQEINIGMWDVLAPNCAMLHARTLEKFRDKDGSFTFKMCATL